MLETRNSEEVKLCMINCTWGWGQGYRWRPGGMVWGRGWPLQR